MVPQHEFLGVWLQVNLAAQVGNIKSADIMPNHRDGDNERHESAAIIVNDVQELLA